MNREIRSLAKEIEDFEATESIAKTGTGSRREGEKFEHLIASFWEALARIATAHGAGYSLVQSDLGPNTPYAKLNIGHRSLVIPVAKSVAHTDSLDQHRWLESTFRVSDLVTAFPSEEEAVTRYAPKYGHYKDRAYPKIYQGLTTSFDGVIALIKDGVLHEKILLEYKTGKSSNKNKTGKDTNPARIDGNAHERLSFQILQYLEVATRYTHCSLFVMSNGAFIRYRNKYHVNFHVQADRLRNFAWFSMDYACTATEYRRFVKGLLGWLFNDLDRKSGARR